MPDAIGVFGLINRGLDPERNLRRRAKPFIWSHSHWFHDYERADRWAADALVEAAAAESRFRFIAFPGIDWNCHYIGADCPEAIAALSPHRLRGGEGGQEASGARHVRGDADHDRLGPRPPRGAHAFRRRGRAGREVRDQDRVPLVACVPPLVRRRRVRLGERHVPHLSARRGRHVGHPSLARGDRAPPSRPDRVASLRARRRADRDPRQTSPAA